MNEWTECIPKLDCWSRIKNHERYFEQMLRCYKNEKYLKIYLDMLLNNRKCVAYGLLSLNKMHAHVNGYIKHWFNSSVTSSWYTSLIMFTYASSTTFLFTNCNTSIKSEDLCFSNAFVIPMKFVDRNCQHIKWMHVHRKYKCKGQLN